VRLPSIVAAAIFEAAALAMGRLSLIFLDAIWIRPPSG
jgi:hypothetical protein